MKINQDWLDERCYSTPDDLEPELQRLAVNAGFLAAHEDRLIETLREHKAQLARLPEIVRMLEAQQRGVLQELADALEQHDQLSAAHKLLTAQQQLRQQQSAKAPAQFPYRCNECGEEFMGGRGAMPGDLCPVCSFGHIIDTEVEA